MLRWRGLPRIRVRNTLGNRLEDFEPLLPGVVRMYVCGPTVYDYMHIGHARTYVAFDAIKRYLVLRGYNVIHVQNITDIDDKIINRAREEGVDWREIVDRYSRDYFEMLRSLGIRVHIHPRVTEHIAEIIEFIKGLIEKGHAYVAPSGSVYFDVTTYPHYGELSGRFHPEQWRQEEDVLREKRHPFDFALWKAWKPGEPYWESPWGRGRPGWHIECSVMSSRYLGEQFDIHGGGQDLVFPHHENERAQSEAFFGKRPWVKYWLHTGYLTISGEKMSKSLGNIIPANEAIRKWGAERLRLWLLSAHYRTQLDYSEEALEQAGAVLERLRGAAEEAGKLLREAEPEPGLRGETLAAVQGIVDSLYGFHEAMSNDFNTSKALAAVMEAVRLFNREVVPRESFTGAAFMYTLLEQFDAVFNVLGGALGPARRAAEEAGLVEPLLQLIVDVRTELRRRKIYDLADEIRSRLAGLGVQLLDYPGGRTVWRLRRGG